MRIRDYTIADRNACLAVFDTNVPGFFVPAERAEFAAFLDALPGPYFVVEDEAGVLVGCGGYAVIPGAGEADFCWGMARRERHGTGVGRLLAHARLERIRADPEVEFVALNTSQHTHGFYERLGFRTERVTPDGFGPGLDRCDMRLAVRAAASRVP